MGSHKTLTRFQSINVPTSKRYGLTSISNGIGLLVGPTFSHESRVTEKNITADEHNEETNSDSDQKKDEKGVEPERETDNESNKKQSSRPDFKPNPGMNQFNQRFSGPQNYQLQHPFGMAPANFQANQRFAQGINPTQPNQHPHSPDSILPGQYPFIPPVAPLRFNWDSAPFESTQQYDPIPAFNNPAPFVYPFAPPVNPYQFYQQFHRQY